MLAPKFTAFQFQYKSNNCYNNKGQDQMSWRWVMLMGHTSLRAAVVLILFVGLFLSGCGDGTSSDDSIRAQTVGDGSCETDGTDWAGMYPSCEDNLSTGPFSYGYIKNVLQSEFGLTEEQAKCVARQECLNTSYTGKVDGCISYSTLTSSSTADECGYELSIFASGGGGNSGNGGNNNGGNVADDNSCHDNFVALCAVEGGYVGNQTTCESSYTVSFSEDYSTFQYYNCYWSFGCWRDGEYNSEAACSGGNGGYPPDLDSLVGSYTYNGTTNVDACGFDFAGGQNIPTKQVGYQKDFYPVDYEVDSFSFIYHAAERESDTSWYGLKFDGDVITYLIDQYDPSTGIGSQPGYLGNPVYGFQFKEYIEGGDIKFIFTDGAANGYDCTVSPGRVYVRQ